MTRTIGAGLDPHLDDACCADLVLGLLDAEARRRTLHHAATCPPCETRLRAHVGAAERARGDWVLAGAAAPEPGPAARVVPLTPRRLWWRGALAAAALLLAALALPLLLTLAPERPGSLLPQPGDAVLTREGEAADPRLTAGLEAWRRHDLATAERELSAARAGGSTDPIRRLYLADALLERGDARAALALLRGLDWKAIPEPWRRDGAGVLARALRATGANGAADSLERALRTQGPGTPLVP
jgi:hypothetical protein